MILMFFTEAIPQRKCNPSDGRTMLDIVVRRLSDCIRRNVLGKVNFLLRGIGDEQRQYILVAAQQKLGRKPLIHDAIQQGHLEMIKLLHEKCGSGLDLVHNHRSSVEVAAASGHLGVLKYLVQEGARVNRVPVECNSSPLIEACRKGHEHIVRYLISAGADVNQRDTEGNSCIHALNSYTKDPGYILEVFLLHGADINCTNNAGRTPMHISILKENDCRETTYLKTLLTREADFSLYDPDGYTPLGLAVTKSHRRAIQVFGEHGAHLAPCTRSGADLFEVAATNRLHILLFELTQELKPAPEQELHAWELLVSHAVNRILYSHLRRVLVLRLETGAKLPLLESCKFYGNAHEVTDPEELDLLENDKVGLGMCALYLRECVLGKFHPKVCEGLGIHAANCQKAHDYDAAHGLLFHALRIHKDIREKDGSLFSVPCIKQVLTYASLLRASQDHGAYLDIDFADLYAVVDIACEQVEGVEKASGMEGVKDSSFTSARPIAMASLVNMMHAIVCCLLDDQQMMTIRRRIRPVLAMNPTDECNRGVFHQFVNLVEKILQGSGLVTLESLFLELKLLAIFIQCGAPVHHLDKDGASPLHHFLRKLLLRRSLRYMYFTPVNDNIIQRVTETFLDAGVHIDLGDKSGISVERLLDNFEGVNIRKLHHLSLKCLCARVAKQNVPNYGDVLPVQLADFISLHDDFKTNAK